MDTLCAQFNEEEHIESLQLDGVHGEKICRQDVLFVMRYQVPPADGSPTNRCGQDVMPTKRFLDRRSRYREAQFDEFAFDLAISPMISPASKRDFSFLIIELSFPHS